MNAGARLGLCAVMATTLACGEGFESRTLVTGLRILAVQAEPPEVAPGEPITYTALVAHPDGEEATLVYGFIACTPGLSGCLEQSEALAAAGGDEDQAQIEYQKTSIRYGVAPIVDGSLVAIGANMPAPTTLLEGRDNPEEGANSQLSFFACDAEACLTEGALGGDTAQVAALPPDLSVLGIKRARVSLSEAPNHNPVVSALEIDETSARAEAGGSLTIPVGQAVTLRAVMPPGAAESYSYLNDDGVIEARLERMYVGWYSTVGEFAQATTTVIVDEVSAEASAEVVLTIPDGVETGQAHQIYAVVWDRRGGLGWITLDLTLED